MPEEAKEWPTCPCCGKTLYRLALPGAVFQQLGQMAATEDTSDMTELFLMFLKAMHDPRGAGSQPITPEEGEQINRFMQRN